MTAGIKSIEKSRALFALASLFLIALFFRNAEIVSEAMRKGLSLCIKSLVPSLFPLMVASELLAASGGVEQLGRALSKPSQKLLGLRGDAACAVLLGLACGFPVGTRCALSLYREGKLGKDDFCRVLSLSNHPSPAFLIGTVGSALLGSIRTGVLLYLTTVLSSLLLGILSSLPLKMKKSTALGTLPEADALSKKPLSFSSALASAVSASALSLLSICAFVVFFSVLVECLAHLAAGLSLSELPTALLFSFFELTGGVVHASECSAQLSPMLCAFSVGWAGLSVHFQLFHLVGEAEVSKGKYLLMKLCEGCLNLPIFLLLTFLF